MYKYITKEEKRTIKVKKKVEEYGFKFIRIVEHYFKDIDNTTVEVDSLECKHRFISRLSCLRLKNKKGDKLCTKSTCRKKRKEKQKRRKWDIKRVEKTLKKSLLTNLEVDPAVYEKTMSKGKNIKVALICVDCGEINYVNVSDLNKLESEKTNNIFCIYCSRERRNKEVEEFFKKYHPDLEFIKTFRQEGQRHEKTMYKCKIHKTVYVVKTGNIFTRDKDSVYRLSGCPECATSGIKHDSSYIVYYLRMWDEELLQWLYKIGITWGKEKVDAKRRMKQISKKMQLVEIVGEFEDYYAARAEESRLHELYKKDSVPIEYMEKKVSNGGSEFFWKDVLEVDIQSEQIPILV